MKLTLKTILGLILTLAAGAVFADDNAATTQTNQPAMNLSQPADIYNIHHGIYIEGNAGGGLLAFHDDKGAHKGMWGVGVNGNLGYQFTPHFALEGGATYLPNLLDGFFGLSDDFYLYDVALKGIMPLDNRFSLYGKLGGALVNEKLCIKDKDFGIDACDNENSGGVYVGTGLAFAITHHLDLSAGINGAIVPSFSGHKNTSGFVGLAGLGLTAHFG